jgi:hypothetical protein
MSEYLIAFNDDWVPDHTLEQLQQKSRALRPLVAEMKAAGVLIFIGGLDDDAPVLSVDPSNGTPLFIDGPFAETKELIAGFWLWQVKSMDEAVEWARRCPNPFDIDSELEIRQVYELEDFGAEFTPELREQEERLRMHIEKK